MSVKSRSSDLLLSQGGLENRSNRYTVNGMKMSFLVCRNFVNHIRAQRFHKEHKDTQAQGFVSFVHPLCSSW